MRVVHQHCMHSVTHRWQQGQEVVVSTMAQGYQRHTQQAQCCPFGRQELSREEGDWNL